MIRRGTSAHKAGLILAGLTKARERCESVASGRECPDCGETDIMDNGEARGSADLSFCCSVCGAQWDAEAWREKADDARETEREGRRATMHHAG